MNNVELSSCVRFERAAAPGAAAFTDITGTTLDLLNAERVCFVCVLGDGTTTGTVLIKFQSGAASDLGDAADVTGATTVIQTSTGSDTDNKLLILDIIKPGKRYGRIIVDRGTANHVVESVIACIYCNRVEPVTQTNSLSTVVALGQ